jgi:hypothetical protein
LHNAGGGWGERRLFWSDVFAVDLTIWPCATRQKSGLSVAELLKSKLNG